MDDLLTALMGQPARDGRMPRFHPEAEAEAAAQAAAQIAFLGVFDPVLRGSDSNVPARPAPAIPFVGRMAELDTGSVSSGMAMVVRADDGDGAMGFVPDKVAAMPWLEPGIPPPDRAVALTGPGDGVPFQQAQAADVGPDSAGFGEDGVAQDGAVNGPNAPDAAPVAVAALAPPTAPYGAPAAGSPPLAPVIMEAKARNMERADLAPQQPIVMAPPPSRHDGPPLGPLQAEAPPAVAGVLRAGSVPLTQRHDIGGEPLSTPAVPKDAPPTPAGMPMRAPIWPDVAVKTAEPPVVAPPAAAPPAPAPVSVSGPEPAPVTPPMAVNIGAWLSAPPDRPDALPQSLPLGSLPAAAPAQARWTSLPETGTGAVGPMAPSPAMPDLAPDLLPNPPVGRVPGVGAAEVAVSVSLTTSGVPQAPTTPISVVISPAPLPIAPADHPEMAAPQVVPQAVPQAVPVILTQSAPATPARPGLPLPQGDVPLAAPLAGMMQAAVDAQDIGPVAVTAHALDPSPGRWTAARRAAPDLPPMLARSIAQGVASLSRDPGAMLEIALDPPELGRVRLSFVEVNGALGLSIVAERPETADLMRRHLAVLAEEFARAGLDAPSVDISGGRGGRAGEDNPRPPPAHLAADFPQIDGPIPAPVARASAVFSAGGGLDLRL